MARPMIKCSGCKGDMAAELYVCGKCGHERDLPEYAGCPEMTFVLDAAHKNGDGVGGLRSLVGLLYKKNYPVAKGFPKIETMPQDDLLAKLASRDDFEELLKLAKQKKKPA